MVDRDFFTSTGMYVHGCTYNDYIECVMYIYYYGHVGAISATVLRTILILTVGLMSALWRDNATIRCWKIPKPCEIFSQKYDSIQQKLQSISCMHDLLSGKVLIELPMCDIGGLFSSI